jgi:hypothetical protein
MKNFNKFFESKGVSDDIINFTEKIYKKYILSNNNELIINLIGEKFKIFDAFFEIRINLDKEMSFFNPFFSDFKNDILYRPRFYIGIKDENSIKEKINHELNHCLEYYKIKQNENKLNFDIDVSKNHQSVFVSISNIKYDNIWDEFKYLIYLSLNSEYNSRVSEMFEYLYKFKSTDEDFLRKSILQSDIYRNYKKLENFNAELFLIKSEKLLGLNTTIQELNKLYDQFFENNVNKLPGYKFIKKVNEDNILSQLKRWENQFKYRNEKHLQKIDSMVGKVIEEINKPIEERYETLIKNKKDFLKGFSDWQSDNI